MSPQYKQQVIWSEYFCPLIYYNFWSSDLQICKINKTMTTLQYLHRERKWCLQFRKCIMWEEDNTSKLSDIRLQLSKFWVKTFICSCNNSPPGELQSSKWRHLYKKQSVVWVNNNKCLKRVQLCCRTGFEVDEPYKPSMYAFYKQFCEADCVNGEVPFIAKYINGAGISAWPTTVHISNDSKLQNKRWQL